MEKPIMLVRENFRCDMIKMIEESRLPLIVVEPILEKILESIRFSIQQQYEKEKQDYEKYLKSQESKSHAQSVE